ncbi:hypothetical protein IT571_06855 [Candidatus Sumerlaeota bacterium]|nr:hypothetical protein [Candidatus Sumerlaeota bacterium]
MFPFSIDREDRRALLLLAATALLEVCLLFVVAWKAAGGHFMLPLDDAYIHLQYARQAAHGDPLVYTSGMQPSAGMTSPFYVLLLVPAMIAGMTGVKGALAAFALGAVLWPLLVVWAYQLAKRLANQACALIAASLVLANGHLLWCSLSGMETALFSVLVVGALLAAQVFWRTEQGHARLLLIACLALLPLTRPEGALVAVAFLAVLLLRRGETPRISAIAPLLALVPLAAWLGLLKYATGDWRPAGLTIKGLVSHPYIRPWEAVGFASETLSSIATRFYANEIPDDAYAAFKGTRSMPYVPVGLGLLAAFGAAFAVITEFRARRFGGGTLLAIVWIAGLCSVAASWIPFVHQQRYLAPWTVPAILLATMALRRIGQLFQQLEQTAVTAGGIALIVLSLPSVGFWMAEYGRNSRDIYNLLRVGSFPLQEERRPIAVTDAGVLAYYSNAPVYDLVGLCSREFTKSTLQGEGATLDALRLLPTERRPHSVVTYREWFSSNFPLKPASWTVSIPRTSITSGTSLGMFEIDWDAIDRAGEAPPIVGSRVILEVDVASGQSERAAAYRAHFDDYERDPKAWPQPLAPVLDFSRENDSDTSATMPMLAGADGARRVIADEFQLRAPETRGDLHLVMRAIEAGASESTPMDSGFVISATSRSTGFRALLPPDAGGDFIGSGLVVYPLNDLLDRAGGSEWVITVEAVPAGAPFISSHYWIIETRHEGVSQ